MKKRLDVLLVDLGLMPSREQSQKVIRAGWVQVDQTVIDKPGTEVQDSANILIKQRSPYVSRGGEKLAGALTVFPISLSDRICLDGGISTGGFTDYLFKNGAKKVYGIDVGYGQLAWEIRTDPRLILKERTNIRYLKPEELYQPEDTYPDLAVLDLSFISLTKVLEPLWHLLAVPREVLLLVKPQFEAGRELIGKNGVVRDTKVRAEAIAKVMNFALELGWKYNGITPSPIQGAAGNWEYWLWLNTESEVDAPNLAAINQICQL
ncbi:hemolysin A [Synechococcus sp. PCC 7502]|uniref:TlyA family RNA methyltransferase n=1 Tax=Synechococcus sp. PCC 7502 TaxID=1173263 RepID=UPI00029FF5A1|nr:TlyA family RNA methyltransferase [Synechococcus sp. PCC 7502]AFY75273.1 hemolysin A [Synechococcus sp. PCC 7502]